MRRRAGEGIGRRRQVNGKPRGPGGAAEAGPAAIARARPPEGRSHWTVRAPADRPGGLETAGSIPDGTVRKTPEKTASAWPERCRCIPPRADGDSVAAMEDVPARCRRDFAEDGAPVRMDGTSRRRRRETRDPRPARPGAPAVHGLGCGRNGVATPFMPRAPPPGRRAVTVTGGRTRRDRDTAIRGPVDVTFPGRRAVPVTARPDVHTAGPPYGTFPPEEAARTAARPEIHHTPGHGSWPDPAETGTGAMARQCADRRIPDRGTMCRETAARAGRRNGEGATVDRRLTAEGARIRLGSLYPSTP